MKCNRQAWLLFYTLMLAAAALIFLLLSPYRYHNGFRYQLIEHTVQINAPVDSVFRFLGNSANARKWSVFVDHISPLNAAEVPDGHVGSRRRCYCRENEQGTQWDEVITEVIPNNKRQISCYNMTGFPLSANGLGTEQIYKPLGTGRCELTFTLFFMTKEPSWWERVKIRIAGYRVKSIYSRNLANIKRIVEFNVR